MKRYFALCIILLIFAGNASSQEIQWKVTEDAVLIVYNGNNKMNIDVKKGEPIKIDYNYSVLLVKENLIEPVYYKEYKGVVTIANDEGSVIL